MTQLLPEPTEVSDALERVYANPEFAERALPWPLQVIAEVSSAVRQWVASLFFLLEPLIAGNPIVARLFIGALVLMAVAATAYLGWRAWVLVPRGSRPAAALPARGQAQAPAPGDATGWEAAARAAEAEGRLRDAAIALYHAALLRLDAHGAIRYDAGKTPGDYRRETRSNQAIAHSFDRLVRLFLPLAFGREPPDVASLRTLREIVGEVAVHA